VGRLIAAPRSTLLAGRRAFVTGGAGGIGNTVARHFVAASAQVVIADRYATVHDSVATTGALDAIDFDACDEERVADAIARATQILGGIDVLAVCHGILEQRPMTDMTSAAWDRTIAVNLTSFAILNRAVLPAMIAQGGGRIINVASQLALKGGRDLTHYAAAKAGVIGMTKSLALEVAASNVLVNVIAPGPIQTPLFDELDDRWKEAKRKELPLQRIGLPDEVAPTAVLLASDPGGNLYTGQTLGPNGGDVMP
jgi:3-oxoacyl-[acyl-carrier protein] reductase